MINFFCCVSDADNLRRLRWYAASRWMAGTYDPAIAEEVSPAGVVSNS